MDPEEMGDLKLFASLAQLLSQQSGQSKVTYCSGTCLDQHCQHKLFFPIHEASVECPSCGQRHSVVDLPDKKVLGDEDQQFGVEVTQLRKMYSSHKKSAEQVKVKGISNSQCKLLSPLLSVYGMGKNDQPSTLKDLGIGEMFDCSKLANRSFAIEEAHLHVLGYGLDRSGSQIYLKDTLSLLRDVNNSQDTLIPLHADGDGHCLVHAISRCLVGRELFWHALRSNLHAHLTSNLPRYQDLFKDFYGPEEWEELIAEAGPDWKPPDGQTLGLCNIHVYGLANVLRRPIILLDSLTGMQSSGDYSGIFLPTMFTPKECSSKDAHGGFRLNSPIIIAWSNSGRNHFIPMVPVKGRPLPKLPSHLQPKVWGSDEKLLKEYIEVDSDGCMEVCGGKELGERYLLRLVSCMDKLFLEKNKIVPSLVSDVNQYVYKMAGCVGMAADTVIATTRNAVEEKRLFRCLICSALSIVPAEWLKKGGMLYQKAVDTVNLVNSVKVTFPFEGISATYNAETDSLVPLEVSCFSCTSTTRRLWGDGTIVYKNGDRTQTVSSGSRCGCGYMHYWDGMEYDNLPEKVPLSLSWGGKTISLDVHWFQYESDPSRNSNVYQVANKVVSDQFPGEFGSERLVQQVVDHILRVTENRNGIKQVSGHHPTQDSKNQPNATSEMVVPASKMILTGQKSRTLHKEELGTSETEKGLRKRIEENARINQNKKKTASTSKSPLTTPNTKTPPTIKTTPSPPPNPKPSHKRIRVSSFDGRTANLKLDLAVTYSQLQDTIERELNIPAHCQKLRLGFPPRELRPPSDPTQPVDLANGEKISVDMITQTKGQGEVPAATPLLSDDKVSQDQRKLQEQAQTLNALLQHMLGKEVDLWSVAQHQPQLFRKGGDYYQQVVEKYSSQLEDNTHLQFKELPNKTFAFNATNECLDLCLGFQHIPVGPLSPHLEQLATTASHSEGKSSEDRPGIQEVTVAGKSGQLPVKVFSGKGHTLSNAAPTTHQPPSDLEEDPILQTVRLVAQKRLTVLREQESLLQQKVRTLNRKLVEAEANEDGASVKDSLLSSIETQLINSSSELKKVREEIKELTSL